MNEKKNELWIFLFFLFKILIMDIFLFEIRKYKSLLCQNIFIDPDDVSGFWNKVAYSFVPDTNAFLNNHDDFNFLTLKRAQNF